MFLFAQICVRNMGKTSNSHSPSWNFLLPPTKELGWGTDIPGTGTIYTGVNFEY